ncbi:MAG TPA: RNA polymerase sigma factor [Acidimicrobiales bacterium]|nr:RNA polymerase sigma factor [Acidimicrobiales bacterium]
MGTPPSSAAPFRADNDVELLAGVARGEPDAVSRLLDEIAPILYGFLFARVGGNQAEAEDLLQETLLEAVRSAAGYRGDAALSTWLCAIARRRLARHYETERRAEAVRHGLRLVEEGAEDPEVEGLDRRDEVVRALGQLSPLHRQVLVLKYLDGSSVEEIAEELGRTRVQVQSLLQRARDALRRELGDHDA